MDGWLSDYNNHYGPERNNENSGFSQRDEIVCDGFLDMSEGTVYFT